MTINSNIENINEELVLIANIFANYENKLPQEVAVNAFILNDNEIQIDLEFNKKFSKIYKYKINKNEKTSKYVKRYAKLFLYELLSKITKYKAPWGALTGVRPTKMYYELLETTGNESKVKKILKREYFLNKKKIDILSKIVKEQSVIKYDFNSIDLYINIPFCTSKCYYCSFISLPLNKCKDLVDPYVDTLIKEIKKTLDFLNKNNISVNTIYVGGGTPTAIGRDNLEKILCILPKVKELTVEAGRPDTIDIDMLQMLSDYNVDRISINPQTFNDDTLKLIGRNHYAEDVVRTYEMARQFEFTINMDLIAGLGNERLKDFKRTLNKTVSLNPDNITIHTLSIKRSSDLKTSGGKVSKIGEVEKMVKYSTRELLKSNYKPYYLYRQKNMLGNLENIGFFRDSSICEFNINSMEETLSVIACGANAISKCIETETNKITRHANVKNIEEYISRIDEMLKKKFDNFSYFIKKDVES